MNFFLQQNKILLRKIDREIDAYVPLRVNFQFNKILSKDSQYIALESEENLVELNTGIPEGELLDLSSLNKKVFILGNSADFSNLITTTVSSPVMGVKRDLEEIYLRVKQGSSLYFFTDGLFLSIEPNLESVAYKFVVNELFSIFTDEKYQILGFFFSEISEEEAEKLKTFLNFSKIQSIGPNEFNIGTKKKNMTLNNKIINAILELHNIDIWGLLYEGLKKKIIEESFVIQVAEHYLETGSTSEVALELAGLLKHEDMKVGELLASKYKSMDIDTLALYNEVWFYLCSLQQIQDRGLL